jgi:hypothetical protein
MGTSFFPSLGCNRTPLLRERSLSHDSGRDASFYVAFVSSAENHIHDLNHFEALCDLLDVLLQSDEVQVLALESAPWLGKSSTIENALAGVCATCRLPVGRLLAEAARSEKHAEYVALANELELYLVDNMGKCNSAEINIRALRKG